MKPGLSELASLLARRELWLLLSTAYLDVYHHEQRAKLRRPDYRRRAIQASALLADEFPAGELGRGELPPHQLSPWRLFDALDKEWEHLEAAYRQLFGLTATSANCPACAVEYEPNTDITYRAQRLADIAGFYQAFGLRVAAGAGERLDHVTVQAEFLYVLLAKEAAAWQEKNQEAAEICREARRKFFAEHVGWWLPAFSNWLDRVAATGFYRELARLTASLSAIERISLGLPPFPPLRVPRAEPVAAMAGSLDCMKA